MRISLGKKISGILLILLIMAFALIQSEQGRSYVQQRVSHWLAQEYGLELHYRSLQVKALSFGWQLKFKDLRGGFAANTGEVQELLADVNAWNLLVGTAPISAIAVTGADLHLDAAQLKEHFAAKAKSDNRFLSGTTLLLNAIHVDFKILQVDLDATWSGGSLTRLKLASPGFDVPKVMDEVAAFGFMPPSIPAFKNGRVEQLQLDCEGFDACRGSAEVHALDMQNAGWIPGIRNISAAVAFQPHQIFVKLPATTSRLTWPRVYGRSVPVSLQATELSLVYDEDQLEIHVPESNLDWSGVQGRVEALVHIPWDAPKKTEVQLSLKSKQASWKQVRSVLPDQIFSPTLNEWLSQRLISGNIKNVLASLNGEILKFPFTIQADFSAVQLQFDEAWPKLDRCSGDFHMHHLTIEVGNIRCKTDGLLVAGGRVDIPRAASKPKVHVQFQVRSAYSEALHYLSLTPLGKVAKTLEGLPLQIARQFTEVQLDVGSQLEVRGQTEIRQVKLNLPGDVFVGTSESMNLRFDQKGLEHLEGTLVSADDRTHVRVQRDASRQRLDVKLEPLESRPTSLQGELVLSPADAPKRAEGKLSGLTLGASAAQINIDALRWTDEPPLFTVRGDAQIQNFGVVSKALKIADDYQGGHGNVSFDLLFPGLPNGTNAKLLSGHAEIDLAKGHIRELPSIFVSLIHFANLKVFGLKADDLSYEFARGRLDFTQGTLETSNADIDLDVVEVRAVGSVHYPTDTMDMNLKIIPNLGSPAVAIGVGLWNPLVGLSLFGISKVEGKASDSRLNRVLAQTYKLEGKVDHPRISLIHPWDLREIAR